MNTLKGNIKTLNTQGRLTIVTVNVSGIPLNSIIIENPDTVSYLLPGHPVQVMFKETEVVIGKGKDLPLSLDNRLEGKILEVNQGVLLSSVSMETQAGVIKATLTTEAVSRLLLQAGDTVSAFVKTTEIMLSE